MVLLVLMLTLILINMIVVVSQLVKELRGVYVLEVTSCLLSAFRKGPPLNIRIKNHGVREELSAMSPSVLQLT